MNRPLNPFRGRWFVPQFSLRALFVLVTLSAIVAAVWYRRPIVEDLDLYARLPPQVKARTKPEDMKATRAVNTYRSDWAGNRVQHGWSRKYNFQGQLVSEEHWRDNQRHGPYRQWNAGKLRTEGRYMNGRMDGVWRTDTSGFGALAPSAVAVGTWQKGTQHGVFELHDAKGRVVRTIEYRDGIPIRVDGQPWSNPATGKAAGGQVQL